LLVVAAALAVGGGLWWLWPRQSESLQHARPATENAGSGRPEASAAQRVTPPAAASESAAGASKTPGSLAASEPPGGGAPEPSGDLRVYAERPMSTVAHRVTRAWGLTDDPKRLGLVGAYVVVNPGTSDEQLAQLCRDIQQYHRGARALSVRIFDSDAAASSNSDAEGGSLRSDHLVARVTRDPTLGVDGCIVRGQPVQP
jgi:hypothetical protein